MRLPQAAPGATAVSCLITLLLPVCARAQSTPAAQSPAITLILSGGYRGRVEGCGCPSGLTGGLAHRAALQRELFPQGQPVGLDCGGLLDLDPDLGKLNSRCAILGLARLGLKVVGVVPRDLFYGVEFLRGLADTTGIKLASANLVDTGNRERLFSDWVEVDANGRRIAVTSLSAYEPERRITGFYGWTVLPPDSVMDVISLNLRNGVDFTVLLTDMGEGALRGLLIKYQMFDLVVSSGRQFQTTEPFTVGKTVVVHPAPDGRALEWVTMDGERTGGNRCEYHNQPVLQNRRLEKETRSWLEGCLGRNIR